MNDNDLVEYLTRMDCRSHSVPMIAARRGWDCFKEEP